MGYAKGKNKITLVYTTDLRFQDAADGRYDLNLMLTKSATEVLRFEPDDSPFEVAFNVDKFLKTADKVMTEVKRYGNL